MKLYLVRHGETTGDIEDRYGGAYDDHLTARGVEQLIQTAERLRGTQVDCLYHSTLMRAVESADILHAVVQGERIPTDGLRERDYGVLGGLTKAEALEKYPEAVEAHKDPANTDPEGEPQADFINRVETALREILASSHATVMVVAHGGSLKVMLRYLEQSVPDSIGDGEVIEVDWE